MQDEVLVLLKSHPFYEDFEKYVLDQFPELPSYNPRDNNTEEWKYKSAFRDGFDLCLTLFQINRS